MRTLTSLLLAAVGLLAADDSSFAVRRQVATTTEREELAAIDLDRHACASTRDEFPDVRVLKADGQAVPFILQRHTQFRTQWLEQSEPARRVLELVPDPEGNRLETVLEPPREEAPAWIDIVTPIRDFEKRVSVFIPAANSTWQAVTENQAVYDYSRFMDVRRCRVLLPGAPAAARYRVVIADVTDTSASAFVELTTRSGGGQPDQETVRKVLHRRDFRIDRIEFGYRVREERRDTPVLAEFPLSITGSERDAKEGTTRLTLESGRLPITALRFAIGDRNVSRPVYVEVRRPLADGTYQWQRLGLSTLLNVDFRSVREESLTVSITETRATELRVTIVDKDSPPLTIQSITGISPVYRVIFLAEPGVTYQLAYGSATAPPPRYDEAVLRRLSDLKDREIRTLALQATDAPPASPRPGLLLRLLNSRAGLIVALGLAVAVLALAMVKSARRIGPEEGGPPATPPAAAP